MLRIVMPTKNLEITKDNYKGYLELYQLMMGIELPTEEYQEYKKIYSIIQLGINVVYKELERNKNLLTKINISNYTNPITSLLDRDILLEEQKKLQDILMSIKMLEIKYPYLNRRMDLSSIETALEKVKLLIIKKENSKIYYKLDYKSFKKYLHIKELLNDIEYIEEYKSVTCSEYTTPYVKIKNKRK